MEKFELDPKLRDEIRARVLGEGFMVRQAKLGRANRMKGVCTAKKTKCR
ncbi:MAG: hypothetical protein IJG84_03795 [Kiritimatiellae bacterium]|nr:hypothetical protein [Kiritimatiellia bacterium]